MKKTIQETLKSLEKEHDIKILYAVESGSRAWGFASEDSDWDVRFIYIHRPEWYLRLDRTMESFNTILENDIDLSGWELQKTLKLLRKSNPPLLEWLDSPIVYQVEADFLTNLKAAADVYFNPKAVMYHYLSMAKKTCKAYFGKKEVILKKYFYVLRPILAAQFARKHQKMGAIDFETLLIESEVSPVIVAEIKKLLVAKRNATEKEMIEQSPVLKGFIKRELADIESFLTNFKVKPMKKNSLLDELFYTEWQRF